MIPPLEELNADGTEKLPMPAVVIVDAERRIRWIDVHPDFTTRIEVTEVLAADGQDWPIPPVTNSSVPVTELARNRAAVAISEGWARRPMVVSDTR
jgi:hypothetical protein